MTLEEKRQKIREYCERDMRCDDCPLSDIPGIRSYKEYCYIEGADIDRNYRVLFGDDNPYWERICKLSERQRAKGMSTYGKGLENNTAAMLERISHLEEELIDGLMYCEWIKDKLEEGEEK